MIKYLIVSLLFISTMSWGQTSTYNTYKGFVAKGYDVVSYFQGQPKKGKNTLVHSINGAKFMFDSQKNLDLFKANPYQYIPQYGGWCAYAIAKNKKATIDPETYEIRDHKLYLFYNKNFNNTLKSWLKEGPELLRKQADKNWADMK